MEGRVRVINMLLFRIVGNVLGRVSQFLAVADLPGQLHQHVPNVEDRDCNVELAADQPQVLLKRAEPSLAKHRISV